ncbi:MAG TPA: hypothetical protein VKM55_15780 [Candidatus Lokiarchaeia archaeon]|nr:hypothetical protein [Candidatus Lokiarchaeia archaeon]
MNKVTSLHLASRSPANAPASRIIVLDYLKGIAAVWFTLGHTMMYYQDGSWETIMGISILLLDWLTICLYVTCTIIGTMLSIRQKEAAGNTHGMFKNAAKRSIYFFVVGEVFNIVIDATNKYKTGIWHVFGANMITVVACAQLFTYGLVKLDKRIRFFLAIALIILYPLFLDWCLAGITLTSDHQIIVSTSTLTTAPYIIYYLLFDMDAMMPTLSWLITAILTSVVFEEFINAHVKISMKTNVGQGSINHRNKKLTNALANLACFGIIAIFCSVIIGDIILSPGVSSSATEYGWVTNNDAFKFYSLGGLPLFLIRHTPLYLVYNLGVFAVAFSALHFRNVVHEKKVLLQNSMTQFGKYSFSVFVYGEILNFIPIKINLLEYLVICVPFVVILFIAVNLWASRGKGIGSLEWGMNLYSRFLDRLAKNNEKRVSIPSRLKQVP